MDNITTIEGPGPMNPIGTPRPAIDWTKPVQTMAKIPVPVHIYAIDHRLKKPVIGKLDYWDDVGTWNFDGTWITGGTGSLDLMNVPEAP